MKKLFLLSSILCAATLLLAQNDNLFAFNQTRLMKQKRAMTILGTWAITNIAAGAALQGKATGEDKAFHQMNAGWNLVNLGLAVGGYWTATHSDPASFDLFSTIHEQHKIQKVLLFNAGLDVGYMMGGAYLMERFKNMVDPNKSQRAKGFGKSILLQGAFLFAFDIGATLYLRTGNDDLLPILDSLSMTSDGIGMRFVF